MIRREHRKLALYAALFFAGQAASLQLVRCGNAIGYQHLRPLERPWMLAIVVIEALAVLASLRSIDFGAIRRVLGKGQLAGVALVLFFTSAALSKSPIEYAVELVLATAIQLVHLGALAIAVSSVPPDLLKALGARLDRFLERDDRLPLWAALWVTLAAALLAWFSYQRHPHIPDEVVYLYHARYLAKGMLTMPLPAAAAAFNVDLMMYQGDVWYCPVPIGWPAVLAIGAFLRAEWLVNPILGGLGVLLAHVIVRGLYGLRTARIATIFIAASPWYLFLAMSFMTHTWTLFSALMAGYALLRLHQTRHARWAALSGAFIGVVSLIRPLEGLAVGATLGLWTLAFGSFAKRLEHGSILGMSAAVVGAIQLVYNRALTGAASKFPIMHYTDTVYGKDSNALGFGPNRGLGWTGLDPFPGHGPIDVAVNAMLNAFQIATELHGWALGSLLFVAIALFSRKLRPVDRALAAGAFLVVFLHSFYWFSGGPDFGARYWFLVFFPCIVLSVRGVELLDGPRVRLAVTALVLGSVLLFVPWRAVDKYHHYRLMRPDVRELAEQHRFGKSLVLVRGRRHPDYASAVTYNPISFDEPVPIYAWDQDRAEIRKQVVEAYPDRRVYVVDGPSVTGRGFEVVAGPLEGIEAVEREIRKLDPVPVPDQDSDPAPASE